MMQLNLIHRVTLFCFLLVTCITSQSFSQTKIAGRNVTFETDWVTADTGYYRVKVILATVPAVPVGQTEEYSVVIAKRDYQQEFMTVAEPLVLEAGQTTAETEIFFPVAGYQGWQNRLTIHLENNGNMKLDRFDLCNTSMNLPYQPSSHMPTMLFISSAVTTPKSHTIYVSNRGKRRPARSVNLAVDAAALPAIDSLQTYYPEPQTNWTSVAAAAKTNPTALDTLASDRIHAISSDDVPENWLGLTSADIIVVSYSDLKGIEEKSPERMEAIRKWTAVGGTLVVNDCGDQFKEANKVRSVVTEQPNAIAEKRTPWFVPNSEITDMTAIVDPDGVLSNGNSGTVTRTYQNGDKFFVNKPEKLVMVADEELLNKMAGANKNAIAFCDYLLGRVVVTGDDMLAWKDKDWTLLHNTVSQKQFLTRHQLGSTDELRQPNVNFAIPGVGAPPVNLFQILITIFLLCVGPISYVLLKRKQRLQLLFATAPVFSVLACLALVAYAIISDGFQVRGRVASITSIDHVSGKAVTFTRHAHYSGITPRPYEFNSDQFVINEQGYGAPKSVHVQTDRKTEVFGGEIQPRTPHQLAVVQVDETEAGLQLLSSSQGAPAVKNNFAHTVRLAFFKVDGTFYKVGNLAPGDSQNGDETKTHVAKIRDTVKELSPRIDYGSYVPSNRNNYYYGNQPVDIGTGMGDRVLAELRNGKFDSLLKGDRTYLAIMEESELSQVPQEGIDYKLKMHVVGGRW